MRKKILIITVVLCSISLSWGCSKGSSGEETETNTAQTGKILTLQPDTGVSMSDAQGNTNAPTLYISTGSGSARTYPFEGTGAVTADGLVKGIAELTGWNLTLSDEITEGKGGMTVSFSKEASIFTGPPARQENKFHVSDQQNMLFAALDSIQKTLQNYASPTNPESVDIYFCMEGDVPITIASMGITIPMDKPYTHKHLAGILGIDGAGGNTSLYQGGAVNGNEIPAVPETTPETYLGNTTEVQETTETSMETEPPYQFDPPETNPALDYPQDPDLGGGTNPSEAPEVDGIITPPDIDSSEGISTPDDTLEVGSGVN